MSRPPARAPQAHEPHDRALKARVPYICELHVCEPLIATLVLLIALLTYGQGVPAPFVPVPRPSTGAAAGQRPPTQSIAAPPALAFTPTPTVWPIPGSPIEPSLTPTTAAVQPTSTPIPDLQATATPTLAQMPIDVATATATPALTPTEAPVAAGELTPTNEPTLTPGAVPTPTPTEEPTPTTAPSSWDLAWDIIGLWEHADPERQYYFDFLADGLVIVAQNGARTYGIEGERTIVIQMPGDPWILTVRDLSGDSLILEGVFGASDEFRRRSGIPNLRQALIGLWTDPDHERYPLEFTPGGIALGGFGRGTYRVAPDPRSTPDLQSAGNHVLIDCDDPVACASYREDGQSEDAPLSLRVYEIAANRMTVLGLGLSGLSEDRRWTLERADVVHPLDGHPMLGADIVGLWEDEDGSTLRFTPTGELLRHLVDDEVGRYEVLSETTLWVTFDDEAAAWVVTEIDANSMAYRDMDFFWDEPWVYARVE